MANHTAKTAATPSAGASQRVRHSTILGRDRPAESPGISAGRREAETSSPRRAISLSASGVSADAASTRRIFLHREHVAKWPSHFSDSAAPSACSA